MQFFKQIKIVLAVSSVALLSACTGYSFLNSNTISGELKNINLQNVGDPTLKFSLEDNLERVLISYGYTYSDAIPTLTILSYNVDTPIESLSDQSGVATRLLKVSVRAELTIPNVGNYLIEESVDNSYFNNSYHPLAQQRVTDTIRRELMDKLSRKLIERMIYIYSASKHS